MKTTRTHLQVLDENGRQIILWRVSHIAEQYGEEGHRTIEFKVEYVTESGDTFEPQNDGSFRCFRTNARLTPA